MVSALSTEHQPLRLLFPLDRPIERETRHGERSRRLSSDEKIHHPRHRRSNRHKTSFKEDQLEQQRFRIFLYQTVIFFSKQGKQSKNFKYKRISPRQQS